MRKMDTGEGKCLDTEYNGGPWEWRTLGVANPGSDVSWEWWTLWVGSRHRFLGDKITAEVDSIAYRNLKKMMTCFSHSNFFSHSHQNLYLQIAAKFVDYGPFLIFVICF